MVASMSMLTIPAVPDACSPDQADSVLRLVANPWGSDWRPLGVGIDSLDCGYYVTPLHGAERFLTDLDALRQRAQGQHQPLPWDDTLLPGMLYPGAGDKSHSYRYHLESNPPITPLPT